mmetsp:Transcript_27120/g.62216  ORF Transcript_27120/g.62216 Transcript_27120/m.62216 type:complete len:607 (+) Transcript_27120:74-1894(+)
MKKQPISQDSTTESRRGGHRRGHDDKLRSKPETPRARRHFQRVPSDDTADAPLKRELVCDRPIWNRIAAMAFLLGALIVFVSEYSYEASLPANAVVHRSHSSPPPPSRTPPSAYQVAHRPPNIPMLELPPSVTGIRKMPPAHQSPPPPPQKASPVLGPPPIHPVLNTPICLFAITVIGVIPRNKVTENADGVGVWGGKCRCPDGEEYLVGDEGNYCGSLACAGGQAGVCERQVVGGWARRKVECGGHVPSSELLVFDGQNRETMVAQLKSTQRSLSPSWFGSADNLCIKANAESSALCFELHDESSPQYPTLHEGCLSTSELRRSTFKSKHMLNLTNGATLSLQLPANVPPLPPSPPTAPAPSLPVCPQPSRPPLLLGPQPRAQLINQRFREGHPSNILTEAGVFLSQFDGMRDEERPWLPCRQGTWCGNSGYGDRFSGSVINARLPNLYSSTLGGVIVSPFAVKLRCAYPSDASTQGSYKNCAGHGADCIPGCFLNGKPFWCSSRRDHPSCPWPADKLEQAMLHHEETHPNKYNELIFDPDPWVAGLPDSIYAFFVPVRSMPGDVEKVKHAHALFVEQYKATNTPLLIFDYEKDRTRPFRVAKLP